MKTRMLIVLLLLINPFNSICQIKATDSIELDIVELLNRTSDPISLWGNIDFDSMNQYSLIYQRVENDSNQICLVQNIEVLKQLKEKYHLSKARFNNNCETSIELLLYLMKDKQVIDFSYINWDCNILISRDGSIRIDSSFLNNSYEKLDVVPFNETFNSKSSLNKRIININSNLNLLSYWWDKEFKEVLQIQYEDLNNVVNKILKDDFWLKAISNETGKNIALHDQQDKYDDIIKTIFQYLIRKETGSLDLVVENWELSESNKLFYLLTISYTDENNPPKVSKILNRQDKSTYYLTYLMKKL